MSTRENIRLIARAPYFIWVLGIILANLCLNVSFVCADVLRISQQSFSHIGTFHEFLG